jgi:hypothetical protein
MEEVALLALPRDVDSDAESESESGSSKGLEVVEPNLSLSSRNSSAIDHPGIPQPSDEIPQPEPILSANLEESPVEVTKTLPSHDTNRGNNSATSHGDEITDDRSPTQAQLSGGDNAVSRVPPWEGPTTWKRDAPLAKSPTTWMSVKTATDTIMGFICDGKFKCCVPGCNDILFGRSADLRRHYEHVHNRSRLEYYCPSDGCIRSRKPSNGKKGRSFGTRKDKMKEHVREVHARDRQNEDAIMPQNPVEQSLDPQPQETSTMGARKILPKTSTYVRPQHPIIMCQFCQERPEGFRGTHELERHIARAHASARKGYICVDYSADKKFLASCKHCRNKKVYGAYYNAAAHLRRAHFHPHKRGRKGKNDEKRGGIGGGDHPAMDYLKQHWIKEIEVSNVTPPVPNDESDIPDSETDVLYNLDEEEPVSAWLDQVPTWESAEGLHAGIGHSEPLRVLEGSEGAELGREDRSQSVFTF